MALIAVGVFFPVYLGVAGAILSVDRKLVEVGRVFRLSRLDLARRILLPAVLPDLLDRAALGPRPRLHVRGRGRVHGRVGGPRLSAGRRPAARQAGPDPGRHHRLRAPGQGGRQPPRRGDQAARALAGRWRGSGSRCSSSSACRQDLRRRHACARRRDARRCARARSWRSSAARAAARPRCCASSPGLDRPTDGAIRLDGERHRASRTRRSGSSSRSRGCCPG